MKTIKDLVGTRKGENALVICAGSSTRKNREQINGFVAKTSSFTIGINNITDFYIPRYHLWTNTKRFRTFGKNIYPKSTLLLGSNIYIKVIKEVIENREYVLINYTDMKEGVPIDYKDGKIYGFYRTAGCLSIMIAHLMGAKEINIIGMDGHTLYDYKDIKSGKKRHHCYNEDYTPYSQEICIKKDKVVNGILHSLKDYGIKFNILTPTKYENFYNSVKLYS